MQDQNLEQKSTLDGKQIDKAMPEDNAAIPRDRSAVGISEQASKSVQKYDWLAGNSLK